MIENRRSAVIVFTVLLIGVAVAVVLTGRAQFFWPRAEADSIVIKDSSGNPLLEENGVPVTNSTSIRLQLNAPTP